MLNEEGITLLVRADGTEPVQIVQIQIDGAYWVFSQNPPGALPRLGTTQISIPYPWVKDETHAITLITRSGLTFEHVIEVAVPTPGFSLTRLLAYALLGIYVGVVPVGLGLLFFPYLRTLGTRGLQFLLALTIGLLAFLLIDTLQEGLELATDALAAFQASALVWLAAGLSLYVAAGRGSASGQSTGGPATGDLSGVRHRPA